MFAYCTDGVADSVTSVKKMQILVTGATGLIGAEVLRQSIQDPGIHSVIAISRGQPEVTHSKIQTIIHPDFLHYESLAEVMKQADALIWCLGISQTQVSRAQYETITYQFTEACATSCAAFNPAIRFVFVSGDGADRTEKSSTLFKRIKGRAENALLHSGLQDLYIARPDAVRPRHRNKKAPLAYKLFYPFFPIVATLSPNSVIWSDVLARALLHLAKEGHALRTLENLDLQKLGKTPA